jgi:hypothetical protein
MATKKKKAAKKKGKYDITVKSDLSFEQLMQLAINKPPKKPKKS